MNQNKIGKFIFERRRKKGLTQDDIAKELKITSQSVSKWERGVNVPDISVLKDLSNILGVTVEELLKGKIENDSYLEENDLLNSNVIRNDKNKNIWFLLTLGILIVLMVFVIIFIGSNYNKKTSKPDNYSEYTDDFVEIKKDNSMVYESLSYVKFMLHLNEPLVEKLFDKNETKVTKDDFSKDEKMYLVLSKCSRNVGGFIYYAFDYYFQPEDLEGLVFENTSFIKDYTSKDNHYLIQNSIDLIYERGLFNATASPGGELEEPSYVFDLLDVKRNNEKLVIDFKLGYVRYDFINNNIEPVGYVYKNIKDTKYIEQVDSRLEYDDEHKMLKAALGEEYNKFRYTLKIVNDKVYFDSIERI